MLLEHLNTALETREIHILFGAFLGLSFGIIAQSSRFCLRRGVAGPIEGRAPALGTWMMALFTAILSLQILIATGWANLGDHRYLSPNLPVVAIIFGGLIFGVGMALTRGCITRLTILSATGNLRAAFVVIVFTIVAHAMIKGILAPITMTMTQIQISLPIGSLTELSGGQWIWTVLVLIGLALMIWRTITGVKLLIPGVLVGLLVALGWVGTSVLLMDEFDPFPVQSLALTQPWSDSLFWIIAATAIPASFGTGFIGGILSGSFLSALVRKDLRFVGFDQGPNQMLRYGLGGVLMAVGAVLAGGCTISAGLSGGAMLSIAAILALLSIIAGGYLAGRNGRFL